MPLPNFGMNAKRVHNLRNRSPFPGKFTSIYTAYDFNALLDNSRHFKSSVENFVMNLQMVQTLTLKNLPFLHIGFLLLLEHYQFLFTARLYIVDL